ncbi:hypothetical protein ACHAXH_009718 [Discostella pseudostelligera]
MPSNIMAEQRALSFTSGVTVGGMSLDDDDVSCTDIEVIAGRRQWRYRNIIFIMDAEKVAELRKKRTFKKFTFRGIELDALLDLTNDELMDLVTCRARRRMSRGLKRKPMALIKRLRQAKKEAEPGEKPRGIKTHLRNMIIVPEMIGSIVGIYNGKMFCGVEMKPEMVGMYLGEFAITYKPVRHGRPGVSASTTMRFIPL